MKRGQSTAYYDAAIARWWTKLRRAVNELDRLRAARERARKRGQRDVKRAQRARKAELPAPPKPMTDKQAIGLMSAHRQREFQALSKRLLKQETSQ